jgi:LDH2 family malate/lactate/ureidoglycolate dehydrogenase
VAYQLSAFGDVATFKRDMDDYLRSLKNTPPAPGQDRVVYAGLPEHEAEIERREKGIPYHPEVIDWFRGMMDALDLPQAFG